MKLKFQRGDEFELQITDLAFGGAGIARHENLVIFVDGGLPGQTVRARVKFHRRRHVEAYVVEILERSPDEREIEFQPVPGAPWETLPIEMQREIKKRQVVELFKKFVQKNIEPVWDEYVLSPREWWYRNKMDFSFGTDADGNFALGSKKRGQFRLVENLESPCGLFDEKFEKLLPTIREWCQKTGLPPHDGQGGGFFESLVVRRSIAEDKFLVEIVVAGPNPKFAPEAFGKLIQKNLGERFGGVFWTQKIRTEGAPTREISTLIAGEKKLHEKLGGLEFEISRDAFFQPNLYSAEELYKKVVQFVDLQAGESALDLFCGTGTIAQILAKKYPKSRVVGVEIVESAVADAKKNAEKNGLKNVTFACADVRKWLKSHHHAAVKSTSHEVVVVDPPRSGIVPKSLQRIVDRAPGRIVYVSCNPATLARDTAILEEAGYTLEKLALVDQFPHTSHVEAVARFTRVV